MARTPQGMRPTRGHCRDRTAFALSGLSGSVDLLPTVGSGIRPDLLTFRHRRKRSRARPCGPTAGGDFHPALKTFSGTGRRPQSSTSRGQQALERARILLHDRTASLTVIIKLAVHTSGRKTCCLFAAPHHGRNRATTKRRPWRACAPIIHPVANRLARKSISARSAGSRSAPGSHSRCTSNTGNCQSGNNSTSRPSATIESAM